MRRAALALLLLASLLVATPAAAGPPDDIYRYLDDPQLTGEGQEEPHADLRPYPSTRAAIDRAGANPLTLSLNGAWRLKIFDKPEDARFDGPGFTEVRVPHTWQSDFIDHPIFRNIPSEIVPDDPPRVPRDVNPTGAYLKTFTLPANWAGGRMFLRFEGVTSNYLVWVNGEYVGYDQGGYTPAEYDVTDHLRAGRNTIAVQVHRWGSGAYLEDVDQWRYSGIFRDVWLYRTPQSRIRDAYITTDLDSAYRDAVLTARLDADGPVHARLFDGDRQIGAATGAGTLTMPVGNPRKWSAEEPNLYTLVLQLGDHITAQRIGFREIEVRDRQIQVNGKRN
ncbi:sugar-binding domain-containing protein, partial [Actinoplanes sp. NPDC051633]|uniref:sugar-binding domain-containing protein n=1 Tax=Actinoplanes sp. NPDC051633 TaxID=3155670 RepID=UPI003437657E